MGAEKNKKCNEKISVLVCRSKARQAETHLIILDSVQKKLEF